MLSSDGQGYSKDPLACSRFSLRGGWRVSDRGREGRWKKQRETETATETKVRLCVSGGI